MKRLKLFLLLASLLAASPALAQDLSTPDAIALRNQILQLQAQVNALQANRGNNGGNNNNGNNEGNAMPAPMPAGGTPAPAAAPDSDLMASLLTRISTLEDNVRTLTGQVEQLQNDLKNQNQQLTEQIGDINFQLQGGVPTSPDASGAPAGTSDATPAGTPVNTGGNATTPQSANTPTNLTPGANGLLTGTLGAIPAGTTAAAPDAAPPGPTAADTLQSGIDAYGKKDYKAALAAAEAVLATNRATTLGYDALFLKARALAGKHDWTNAVVAFDDTYKRAKFGSHSQDAQLGEAETLLALRDNGAACGALARLAKQYPHPRADLVKPIAAAHAKACRN
jgi:TolA-binding protein